MHKTFSRRTVEVLAVFLSIALIIGIAVPVYLSVTRKAESVAANSNMKTAMQEIDVELASMSSTCSTYGCINPQVMMKDFPRAKWFEVPPGGSLPAFDSLAQEQKNGFYMSKPNNEVLYVFVIGMQHTLEYSFARSGAWLPQRVVPYAKGIPGIVQTGGSK